MPAAGRRVLPRPPVRLLRRAGQRRRRLRDRARAGRAGGAGQPGGLPRGVAWRRRPRPVRGRRVHAARRRPRGAARRASCAVRRRRMRPPTRADDRRGAHRSRSTGTSRSPPRAGSRPRAPSCPPTRPASAVAMLRDLARRGRRPGARGDRASSRPRRRRPSWSTARAGSRRTSTACASCCRAWEELAEKTEAAPAVVRSLGSRGHGPAARAPCWPGCRARCSGQYETFTEPGEPRPAAARRAQRSCTSSGSSTCPTRDFRLWVCLHEETHRVQFGAVPWLADHLADRLAALLEASDLGARETLQRLRRLRLRADPVAARRTATSASSRRSRRRSRRSSSTSSPRSCRCSRATPTS